MAWQTLRYRLTSSAPLVMHNGQLSDPTNKWVLLIKQITSKRIKTEADYVEVARLEFFGGIYINEEGPIVPADVIDAMLVNSAKKFNEGPKAKAGCFCLEHSRLEYDGPRTVAELWDDERFRFYRRAKIGRSSIQRMRPIFEDWSTTITINIEDTLVDPARVDEWLNAGGTQVGLGDWRPQHGRFTAERLNGS